jgi:hypothetical protein
MNELNNTEVQYVNGGEFSWAGLAGSTGAGAVVGFAFGGGHGALVGALGGGGGYLVNQLIQYSIY